jgi:hypothetical protein
MGNMMPGLYAQKLYLWKTDGTQIPYDLGGVKTISFSSGNLLLNSVSGSTESFSISALTKLSFDNSSTVGIASVNGHLASVKMYLNNSENAIYFQNIPNNKTLVTIYKLNGVLVKSNQINSGSQSIDVSNLVSGFYLVKINNQVFKFVK